MRGSDTRIHIKEVALRLFAVHGVDHVSVRDILVAAQQKNGGSLHYHFGGKDALVRELVADGAQRIDAWRLRRLDAIEAESGPPGLRDIVKLLADPLAPRDVDAPEDAGHISFMNSLLVKHHDVFLEGIEGHDVGFKRCVAHIRRLLPDLPPEILNQRLRLMMLYLFTVVSAREQIGERSTWYRLWQHPASQENFVDTIEGMLREPVSQATRDAMANAATSLRPARSASRAKIAAR